MGVVGGRLKTKRPYIVMTDSSCSVAETNTTL